MNSDKRPLSRQRGNVMIYILIALGLIGALTVAMTRQNDQASGENLSAEQATLQAAQILAYASAAQNSVDQMIMSGTTIDTMNLINPTSSGFNTGSNVHKLFHPNGGGLDYKKATIPPFQDSGIATDEGWYVTKRNIGWSASASTDLILAAFALDPAVCAEINKKIFGTATSVTLSSSSTQNLFTTAASSALTTVECPACDGQPMLCINETNPAFYAILEMR